MSDPILERNNVTIAGSGDSNINDYNGGFERDDVIDLLALMKRHMIERANFLAPLAMGNVISDYLTVARI